MFHYRKPKIFAEQFILKDTAKDYRFRNKKEKGKAEGLEEEKHPNTMKGKKRSLEKVSVCLRV